MARRTSMLKQKQINKRGFARYLIEKRGQSPLEYIILITIILGAFLAVGTYFKRGVQGRWKMSVDDLGDQYDPRVADTNVRYVLNSTTLTRIESLYDNTSGGWWTYREDHSNSTESKSGYEGVGKY
jgi:hypothetical protein